MIRIVGRKEAPGRPILYGTTKEFLEVFSLPDLDALPPLKDLGELAEALAVSEAANGNGGNGNGGHDAGETAETEPATSEGHGGGEERDDVGD
jgi:segregation and condensation protein B